MDMPKTKSRAKKSKNMAATFDCPSEELLGSFEKTPTGKKHITNQRNNETKVKALHLLFYSKIFQVPKLRLPGASSNWTKVGQKYKMLYSFPCCC